MAEVALVRLPAELLVSAVGGGAVVDLPLGSELFDGGLVDIARHVGQVDPEHPSCVAAEDLGFDVVGERRIAELVLELFGDL